MAAKLHAGLCCYRARVPSTSQLPLKLRNARLRLPKFPPWEHLIGPSAVIPDMATRYIVRFLEHASDDQHIIRTSRGFQLSCPRCNAAKDACALTLYDNNQMCSVHCNDCKHISTSKKWLCPCAVPWISCPACRRIGFACQTRKVSFKRVSESHSASRDALSPCNPHASKRAKGPHPRTPDGPRRNQSLTKPGVRHSIRDINIRSSTHTSTSTSKRGESTGSQPVPKRRLCFTPSRALGIKFPHLTTAADSWG